MRQTGVILVFRRGTCKFSTIAKLKDSANPAWNIGPETLPCSSGNFVAYSSRFISRDAEGARFLVEPSP